MRRFILLLFVAAGAFVCCNKGEEPQDNTPAKEPSTDVSIKGILAWSASQERGKDELTATMDNAKSVITLTTTALYTNQTPVDLTKVVIELTLA